MGWVIEDVVRRTRADVGAFRRREWREFLKAIGLSYAFVYLPDDCDAALVNGCVLFRNGLTESRISYAAYHEGGHHLTVAGDVRFWRSRLGGMQGYVTVAKFEQRANEFAELFPIRDGD